MNIKQVFKNDEPIHTFYEYPNEKIDFHDGHHSMSELYAHRHALFCALLKEITLSRPNSHAWFTWKSKLHSDGTMFEGWFIAGITGDVGQITYHLPIDLWDRCKVRKELETAPVWDGHTSNDVLERLWRI